MGSIIRYTRAVFYLLLYSNSRRGFNGLKYVYSVISVIVNSLTGNTKNWESTRSWKVVNSWEDRTVDINLAQHSRPLTDDSRLTDLYGTPRNKSVHSGEMEVLKKLETLYIEHQVRHGGYNEVRVCVLEHSVQAWLSVVPDYQLSQLSSYILLGQQSYMSKFVTGSHVLSNDLKHVDLTESLCSGTVCKIVKRLKNINTLSTH